MRAVWLVMMVLAGGVSLRGQVIAFQGGEPGDSWSFTTSGASADGLSEAQSAANYSSGTQSIVVGGLSGGGSCISGGSGNGQSITNSISFAALDLSTSLNFTRQLSFHFGNRFPACGGTGFDTGENLTLIPIFNGVAQPAVVVFTGASNAILDITQTTYSFDVPPCVSSFAFQLQINLNRNDEFLFVDDITLSTPGFNDPPVLQCWQTLTYNSATGTCEITGTQPEAPFLGCDQTAVFNANTCSWDVSGTLPEQPSQVNCWDDFQLDAVNCQWVNLGVQPMQPFNVNCWDDYQFDAVQCAWINLGTQPTLPSNTHCWDVFSFNAISCQWDNVGSQPEAPTNVGCGFTAVFNETSCAWELSGNGPQQPTPTNCWDDFTFNTNTCSWENVGVEPQQPSLDCYETAVFNDATCSWDVSGEEPLQPTLHCWQTATFDHASCAWVVTGTQPLAPIIACYETATFNELTCSWEVSGTMPIEPITACYETATFNDVSCNWEVTGEQPEQPTLECWQTATFNSITCSWDISGTPFSMSIQSTSALEFVPQTAGFSVAASDNVVSVEWSINGELLSNAAEFDFTFEAEGEYAIVASVISDGGCTATDTLALILRPYASTLFVPNFFTPNFDGLNDFFTVKGEHLSSFEMMIFNRWGEQLFQTTSIQPGWKGFSENGYSYPDGTYVYVIKAIGKDGQVYDRSGSLMLMR